MTRAIPEWIGKTPDTKVPDRVRLRVFEKYGGRCYLSGRKVMPGDAWDLEDIIALVNGGENREANKAPALRDKHKLKTKSDMAVKRRSYKVRKRHAGIRKPSTFRGWRKFDGTLVYANRRG